MKRENLMIELGKIEIGKGNREIILSIIRRNQIPEYKGPNAFEIISSFFVLLVLMSLMPIFIMIFTFYTFYCINLYLFNCIYLKITSSNEDWIQYHEEIFSNIFDMIDEMMYVGSMVNNTKFWRKFAKKLNRYI